MKNIKINFLFFFAAVSPLFFYSCNSNSAQEEADTPTKGKVRLSIDENVRPLADQLVDAFEYTYPDAFLVQSYNSESDVMKELYSDSSELAIMTRPLSSTEIKWFEAKTFSIEHIKIASDAVVILVNKNNNDSSFTVDQIHKMLSGEDSLWSQIHPGSTLGKIELVFDNSASSNLRYLSDTLLGGKGPGKSCYAVQSNDSVVAYVNARPNVIGIVGLNWIGNKYSTDDVSRKEKVVISRIGKDTASFAHPDQTALVSGTYPFIRGVWIVKIGKRSGLGTGFASFSLAERGQLIVQRSGLAPAKPAERTIEIK
jgi:phosphate transport system substrate-binding protein